MPRSPRATRTDGTAALVAGLLGATALGTLGGVVASGALPLTGLGHWARAGVGPAVLAAAGVGLALGGGIGGIAALLRRPAAPRSGVSPRGRVRILRDGLIAGALGSVAGWVVHPGSLLHLATCLGLGLVLATIASRWPALLADGARAVLVGALLGGVALLASPERDDPLTLLLVDVVGFGMVAASWLHRVQTRERAT